MRHRVRDRAVGADTLTAVLSGDRKPLAVIATREAVLR